MVNRKDLRAGVEKMREVAQLLTEWANDMESSLTKKSRLFCLELRMRMILIKKRQSNF